MYQENQTKFSQQPRKRLMFFVSALISCCLFGCDRSDGTISARVKHYVSADTETSLVESENTITLIHDFGVIVQPITKEVACEFEIKNDSEVTWNLKEIVNTCSCTIADMTSPKVEPGKTEKILVVYNPVGEGSFDDSRKSLVIFEGETAPRYILTVHSRVRDQISVYPKSIDLTNVGKNIERLEQIDIQNFSNQKWIKCEIVNTPNWITTETAIQPRVDHEPSMLQQWQANLHIDTKELNVGDHLHTLIIRVLNENAKIDEKSINVCVRVIDAMNVIPGQLFFGQVVVKTPAKQTLNLFFSTDATPSSPNEVSFSHQLGEQLTFNWLSTDGNMWVLEATLTLNEKRDCSNDTLRLSCSNAKSSTFDIPLYYFLSDDDE